MEIYTGHKEYLPLLAQRKKMEHEYSKQEFVTCELAVKRNHRDILWIGQRDSRCESEDITRSLPTINCKFMFIGRSGLSNSVTDN